jgi:hypothetical protein
MNKKEAKNLFKQDVPSRKEDRYQGITVYEMAGTRQNDFPQQLINAVYNSSTASACLEVWEEFVGGDGFLDGNLDNVMVNKEDTLKDLHEKCTSDFVSFWGFAIHVTYNVDGEPVDFNHVPFEQTRLGIIKGSTVTDLKYNPYYGIPLDYDIRYTKTYYPYNPDPEHVIREMANHAELLANGKINYPYSGQMFWYSIEKPLSRVYPVPSFYSVFNYMIVENKIGQFHERNIDNNFMQSVIINVFGDPDAPANLQDANSDNYQTNREVFDEQMDERFSGSKVAGGVLVNWIKDKEEMTTIMPFPTNLHDKSFIELDTLCTENITRGFKVPPLLANIKTAGKLGDSTELLNSIKVMQGRANKFQTILSRIYSRLIASKVPFFVESWDIKNLNYASILPDEAWGVMTTDEKRDYLNSNFPVDLPKIEPIV